jgi:glucose-1-phosphate cytidylyltransferase
MKTIILAGGLGTRISEETGDKPKPMVLINNKPIIWHLMNIYAEQGFNDFVVALGYKGDVIKRWLKDLNELSGDVRFDISQNRFTRLSNERQLDWTVHAIETGLHTQTGGRIKKCMDLFPGETILATYGDGLGNVNINKLIDFHKSHGKLATVTAVRPPARFGHMELSGNQVLHFGEKNQADVGWINGGFFVLDAKVARYIKSDSDAFEKVVLPELAYKNELMAFHHDGFWQPMDTLAEKRFLESQSELSIPPWLDIN